MTMEGPRILAKQLAGGTITMSSDPFPSTTSSIEGGNWNKLNNRSFVNRSYYDLTGYNRYDLTSFFQGVDIQEEFGPNGDLPVWVIDLITTEFVDDDTITNALFDNAALLGDLPGFPGSTMNQEQVIYGRNRTFYTSSTWSKVGEFARTQWGTCLAATSDKIHLTRIVMLDVQIPLNTEIQIPPCNYVSTIIVGKEKELAFMMRQKRSYELAT